VILIMVHAREGMYPLWAPADIDVNAWLASRSWAFAVLRINRVEVMRFPMGTTREQIDIQQYMLAESDPLTVQV